MRLLRATAVLLVLPAFSSAQNSPAQSPADQPHATLLIPPVPLLPESFGPWQRTSSLAGEDPAQADPAAAPILHEDGLDRFATASYTSSSTKAPLTVHALQFGDATGAFSAYTFYRKPGMRPTPGTPVGVESLTGGDEIVFWKGVTVVVATGPAVQNTSVKDLQSLASGLPKVGGRRGQAPLLPTLLPAAGPNLALEARSLHYLLGPGLSIDPRSVHYSLGPAAYAATGGVLPANLILFDKATEVASAEYTTRTGQGLLTLFLCPTPRIAGDQGRAIEAQFQSAAPQGSTPGPARLKRIGPLLALATGGFSPEEADRLLAAVQLPTEATWNKSLPLQFHTEVRKTASLLYSIAVFSGVLGLAAIFLGLFLGYGRAAIRVLQGKPAYTEPEFLRIDLRPTADTPLKPLH